MASCFGKIVVGTYVEIKRSDGKFRAVYSLALGVYVCVFVCESCVTIFVAVPEEDSNRCR
jgi:hypothetical protein